MKLETVLDAMIKAHGRMNGVYGFYRRRQYRKFRDWIIRRDERQKMSIQMHAEYEPSWVIEWLNDPNEDAAWEELDNDGEAMKG